VQRERSATQTPELTGSADFALVVQPVTLTLEQKRKKLGELRRAGKISPEQLDALLILLDRNELPGDVNEYLMGKLEEDRFLRRLNSGAIEGVPTP